MSFLNLGFLVALPVVLAPLALHWLRRRQFDVVPWGAMQFLSDGPDEARKFDQIEEWLLLALRSLALLALVLALARPQVAALFGGSAATHELVVVVDDSLSTDLTLNGVRTFDLVREKAAEVIAAAPSQQPVRVLLAASGPRWLVADSVGGAVPDKAELLAALAKVEPSEGTAEFPRALAMASGAGRADASATRQVVAVTDGQAFGWHAEDAHAWNATADAIDAAERTTAVDVIRADAAETEFFNLSLQRPAASPERTTAGEPVELTVQVANQGPRETGPAKLVWSINGDPAATHIVPALTPGEVRTVAWTSSFDATGAWDVTARLDTDDALGLDNEIGLIVDVVQSAPVLVVADDSLRGASDVAFLNAAMGVGPRGSEAPLDRPDAGAGAAWRSLFAPHLCTAEEFPDAHLQNYQAVVLLAPHALDAADAEQLQRYVREGGGVWMTLGAGLDVEQFDSVWSRGGGGLALASVAGMVVPAGVDAPAAAVHPPRQASPVAAPLADTRRLDVDRVRLHRYYDLAIPAGAEADVVLQSGSGQPLAIAHRWGRGRVVVQAFPLAPAWSTLPATKSFVVFVQHCLEYLSAGSARRLNVRPHESLVFRPEKVSLDGVRVRTPSGDQQQLAPVQHASALSYRYSGATVPGRYEMTTADGMVEQSLAFRVIRFAGESDATPLDASQRAALEDAVGLRFVDQPRSLDAGESAAPRQPAWWPLLFAMVCFMIAESWLAMRVSRQRFGATTALST